MRQPIQPNKTSHPLDANLIDKFLDNQRIELELKAKEIDLQRISNQHSFEFSKNALEKEAVDRKENREFVHQCRRDKFIFASGICVLIVALIGGAMYLGKDQLALEIVKDIIFLLTGGAGGYALGSKKADADKAD